MLDDRYVCLNRFQVQILLRLEIEAVGADSTDADGSEAKNAETLTEVITSSLVIFYACQQAISRKTNIICYINNDLIFFETMACILYVNSSGA